MTSHSGQIQREAGFVLAETLIALAIIAVMTGMFFQIVTTQSGARESVRERREAALVARSLLARVGTDVPLDPGTTTGESDGLGWQVDVEPYRRSNGVAGGAGGAPRGLLQVSVTVLAPGAVEPVLRLQSLRFVP